MPLRPVIVSMSPPDYPLSMVASPQCRFRFARQNHCSAAATSVANFRLRRDSIRIIETPRYAP